MPGSKSSRRSPPRAGRALTEAGFREVADKFKLLSDPVRLRILYVLSQGPLSVGDIAEMVGIAQPTASRQLARLLAGNILSRNQDGTVVYYAVRDPSIYELCETVCGTLEERLNEKPDWFAEG